MNREWDDGESEPSRKQTDTDNSNKAFASQPNRKSIHGNISSEDLTPGQDEAMGEDEEAKNGEIDGNDDDMIDKISSSPSIEDEDINFEFVYALHTFIATVEGQANATKGDTMVLLDDANSYWWLVRVVKDSSIGYLPAEHIETPTERLARLNKHRNTDLTSTMLCDQQDRYKTPLIKAFRKRSTKTVAFADPTYFEASENDYTTEEDEEDQEYFGHMMQRDQVVDSNKEKERDVDESISIEPLRLSSDINEAGLDEIEGDRSPISSDIDKSVTTDESQGGRSVSKPRNGPLRNAEPIFPDDSVETRKITLTPDLLRDDSSPTAVRVSNELREIKRPSQERLERDNSDKVKDKKDRKDKKSGMLSGLFKRKDRKNKSIDEDIEEILGVTKANESLEISPVLSKESDRTIDDQADRPQEIQASTTRPQKQSNFENSLSRDESRSKEFNESTVDIKSPQSMSSLHSNTTIEAIPEIDDDDDVTNESEISDPVISSSANTAPKSKTETNINSKPLKLKQANSPVELDDFGSSQDMTSDLSTQVDGISESLSQDNSTNKPQAYSLSSMVANQSQEDPSSPRSTASPGSTTLEGSIAKTGAGSSTTLATTNFTWSDNNLRSFFDDNTEIKDLLIVIYDNTGVVPAGPEHPIAGNLYKKESLKLTDIANRLDRLLEDWLTHKSRSLSER